jgi:response regulator of citrate/malate metabolism
VSDDIRVLVVEDEPLIAEAHGKYVERVTGFCLAGTALSGQEALRLLKAAPVDLILLDFNLPDLHGLELCRALRAARQEVDIIAVTSNRDLTAVRSAVAMGVVQYLLKPFTFRSMQDRLERYRDYRLQMATDLLPAGQSEIDRAFAALRGVTASTLPSGLSDATLETIARALHRGRALSAAEVAGLCNVSRVTARRYLEHLTEAGVLLRRQRHGGSGRPEVEYNWTKPLPPGAG